MDVELPESLKDTLPIQQIFDFIFNAMGEAAVICDADGRVLHGNRRFWRLTGLDEEEVRHRQLAELPLFDPDEMQPDRRLREAMQGDLRTRQRFDATFIDRQERRYPVHCLLAGLHDEHDALVLTVLLACDCSDQRHLSQQLHHLQKLDNIGKITGGVVHDVNNMLSCIIGAAELLEEQVGVEGQNYLHMIMTAAERAGVLARTLLGATRRPETVSEQVDLHELIRETVLLLRHAVPERIDVETRLDAEHHVLRGNTARLANVLLNLGLNARDAIPEQGRIVFQSSSDAFALQVDVRDDGTGIDEAVRRRIFEPFFTTKPVGKGTGLGLAAVAETMHMHDGEIEVHSEVGSGTSISLRLPFEEPLDESGGRSILVVDDDPIVRVTMRLLLTDLGYRVILAADGEEAVRTYRERSAQIDLVLLDLVMPQMDGMACFRAIRQLDPAARIIVATGYERVQEVAQMRASGLQGYIRKPLDREQVRKALAVALV